MPPRVLALPPPYLHTISTARHLTRALVGAGYRKGEQTVVVTSQDPLSGQDAYNLEQHAENFGAVARRAADQLETGVDVLGCSKGWLAGVAQIEGLYDDGVAWSLVGLAPAGHAQSELHGRESGFGTLTHTIGVMLEDAKVARRSGQGLAVIKGARIVGNAVVHGSLAALTGRLPAFYGEGHTMMTCTLTERVEAIAARGIPIGVVACRQDCVFPGQDVHDVLQKSGFPPDALAIVDATHTSMAFGHRAPEVYEMIQHVRPLTPAVQGLS